MVAKLTHAGLRSPDRLSQTTVAVDNRSFSLDIHFVLSISVEPTAARLERATSHLAGERSIRLSYAVRWWRRGESNPRAKLDEGRPGAGLNRPRAKTGSDALTPEPGFFSLPFGEAESASRRQRDSRNV
jgi:hypothetical protein